VSAFALPRVAPASAPRPVSPALEKGRWAHQWEVSSHLKKERMRMTLTSSGTGTKAEKDLTTGLRELSQESLNTI